MTSLFEHLEAEAPVWPCLVVIPQKLYYNLVDLLISQKVDSSVELRTTHRVTMWIEQVKVVLLLIGLTLLSGIADAYGFLHAARIWQDTRVVWWELGKSSLGFGLGISIYFLVTRYMQQLGIVLPEIQSATWFVVTMVGVALINGQFARWPLIDQVVAGAVLTGIGWLVLRTGG